MLDIYGRYFNFSGRNSGEYKLIIANVETERYSNLYGNYSPVNIMNKKNRRFIPIGGDYSDSTVSIEVDIVTLDGTPLSIDNQNNIRRWLFRRDKYRKFFIEDKCEPTGNEYINCMFINPSKLEFNGGIVGYRVTMILDSDMSMIDINQTLSGNSSNVTVKVNVDTDGDDYVYPIIDIISNNPPSEISVRNLTDNNAIGYDRNFKIGKLPFNTTIHINSMYNEVSGVLYTSLLGRDFPRLLNGENMLRIDGNIIKASIMYTVRRVM